MNIGYVEDCNNVKMPPTCRGFVRGIQFSAPQNHEASVQKGIEKLVWRFINPNGDNWAGWLDQDRLDAADKAAARGVTE